MIQYQSVLVNDRERLYAWHVTIPHDLAEPFVNENRRIKCTLNEQITIQCALNPDGLGNWFIMINKEIRTKLGVNEGDSIDLRIEKDHSKYGMPIPAEFEELLKQDPEGEEYFQKLTPGKQRNLIYIVSKVKNPDGRINKALAIVHHLKEMQGDLNFKILNETIKRFNKL
jgi:bifunctional DNA-binding transcriptional regulator/antitoxin component of YhaV-PrlF toxin-antitoxin module